MPHFTTKTVIVHIDSFGQGMVEIRVNHPVSLIKCMTAQGVDEEEQSSLVVLSSELVVGETLAVLPQTESIDGTFFTAPSNVSIRHLFATPQTISGCYLFHARYIVGPDMPNPATYIFVFEFHT